PLHKLRRSFAHLPKNSIESASLDSRYDRLDRWDELVFLANCDCRLTFFEFNGLGTVTNGEDDGTSRINSPPRTNLLSQLAQLFHPGFVSNPFLPCQSELWVRRQLDLLLQSNDQFVSTLDYTVSRRCFRQLGERQ